MAKPKLEWHGDEILKKLATRLEQNMGRATQIVRNEVVRSLNRSQPTRATSSGRRVGLDPSRPGEPPKQVTSRLKQSIVTAVRRTKDRIIGSVGTNVKYAKHLEFGTRHIAARPFLRPALKAKRDAVRKALSRSR